MSREAMTIASDQNPLVLFHGSYSQWNDRFLDFQDIDEEIFLTLKEGQTQFYYQDQAFESVIQIVFVQLSWWSLVVNDLFSSSNCSILVACWNVIEGTKLIAIKCINHHSNRGNN